MRKLLPILLLLVGTGVGVGAGMFLRPEPEPVAETEEGAEIPPEAEHAPDAETDGAGSKGEATGMEYVKFNNQFVVPVVRDGNIGALVVLSLSLEVPEAQVDSVYAREPKLRDAFLQVLFDHANIGGFDGEFTAAGTLDVLRRALRETAQKSMSAAAINDVLITEIARQDY
ncbi:flagellar basal body-associated FliL family protein [Sulfitobacter sp. LCG007]